MLLLGRIFNQLTSFMTDQDAFEGLKQGDHKVITWVYKTYRNPIVGYFIKNRQLSAETACDLAVDTIVRVTEWLEKKPTAQLTSHLLTLLIGFAKNIDANNGRLNEKALFIEFRDILPENTEGGVDDEMEEILNILPTLVEKMGDRCRLILTKKYWESMTFQKIAEFLNETKTDTEATENSVKMKARRCINELRNKIFKS